MKKQSILPYKWELIILLWMAFFLNQGDRQIYNSVLPLIEKDLGLTPIQLGLVATIFTVFYGVLVPLAGYAGDIFRKKWVVILSLAIFSIGTLFTGVAHGLILLIVFRSIATGGGEAFYYPASNSLIGHYHKESRAQAMALHQTANYTGVVVSGFLAAWIGEKFGWRTAFFSFGLAGIVWAVLLMFRLKEPQQVTQQANTPQPRRVAVGEVLRAIVKKPTVFFLALAFGGMVFVHIGYVTWMPTYLHEKFSLSLTRAGFSSMFYHHVLAYVGVLVGGRISDRLSRKRFQIRMEMEYVGLLLGAPFIYLMGASPSLVVTYAALAGFGLFRGIYDSNLFAALFDVIEEKYRATATGLMLSFAFIVGSLAPLALGWIKQTTRLEVGIRSLGFVYVLSGLVVLLALKKFFPSDYIRDDV